MSKHLTIDLRQNRWIDIHATIAKLKSDRVSVSPYLIIIVPRTFFSQAERVIRDYDLDDVCETRLRLPAQSGDILKFSDYAVRVSTYGDCLS